MGNSILIHAVLSVKVSLFGAPFIVPFDDPLSVWLQWDELHNLVDPASSHMLVSKIKPCMSQYKLFYGETANGSLKQL